jgi:hypothetical protein
MDSDWRPDHITIFEFTQMLGEVGMSKVNGDVLGTPIAPGDAWGGSECLRLRSRRIQPEKYQKGKELAKLQMATT